MQFSAVNFFLKKSMKNSLIPFALIALFVFAGCKNFTNEANVSRESERTGDSLHPANTNTPETTKSDDESILSEEGTPKAQPTAGKSNIQGKVLYNGKPVEGVEVQLCENFSRYVTGCGGEKYKTKTDANGEYLLANVTPKTYNGLLVRVFNTDSYVFATKGFAGLSSATYEIAADKNYFAKTTDLFKSDMKMVEPKGNASVDGANLVVKWEAYPDAASYKLNIQPQEYDADSTVSNLEVGTNEYTVPKILKPGKYTITLTAFNADRVKLSELKDAVSFTVK